MKNIIVFAVLLFSITTAFSQKASFTYQFSFPNGAPTGLAVHYYIPKTVFGVWGDINFKPAKRNLFDNKELAVSRINSSILPNGFTFVDDGNMTYSSMHLGITILTEHALHFDVGAGLYQYQDYIEAKNTNDGKNYLFTQRPQTIQSYRFGVAAQAGKYIRLATNFDFAMSANNVHAFRFVFGLGYFIH